MRIVEQKATTKMNVVTVAILSSAFSQLWPSKLPWAFLSYLKLPNPTEPLLKIMLENLKLA